MFWDIDKELMVRKTTEDTVYYVGVNLKHKIQRTYKMKTAYKKPLKCQFFKWLMKKRY